MLSKKRLGVISTHFWYAVKDGDDNLQRLQNVEEPYQAMVAKGFRDIRHSAADTTDCDTLHHDPVLNENGEYTDADMPYCTMDYIFTYGEAPLTAQRFEVLTSKEALCSSDHCPVVGDFIC